MDEETKEQGQGFPDAVPDAGALSEKLNQVLSDPDSLARLAKIASALSGTGLLDGLAGGMLSGGGNSGGGASGDVTARGETTADTGTSGDAGAAQEVFRTLSGKNGGHSGDSHSHGEQHPHGGSHSPGGKHTALLSALKPYLSEEKRERVDRMLKLLQLAELADAVLRTSADAPSKKEESV